MSEQDKVNQSNLTEVQKREANTCMALGAGVGVLGTASAVITGVVCPLCVFVAPGLIGFGAYRKWRSSKNKPEEKPTDEK